MTTELKNILSTKHFSDIKTSCISQSNTPNSVKLTPKFKADIMNTGNLDDLFQLLSDCPYCSWLDIRLLSAMAAASLSAQADNLIESYEKVIFQRRLSDVLPTVSRKKSLNPSEYYKKVITKVTQNSDTMTIGDLFKFRDNLETVIMDIQKGSCSFHSINKGCIEIHLYMPSELAKHAYESAICQKDKFHDINLQSLQIGEFPKIKNTTAAVDSSTSVTAGKVYTHTEL